MAEQPKQVFNTRGNVELLSCRRLLVMASRQAPDDLLTEAQSFFEQLTHLDITLCGGWQAPLEKALLAKYNPHLPAGIIYYLARDINHFQPPRPLELLLEAGKILFAAPELSGLRIGRSQVKKRDALMLAQNNNILFIYLRPAGLLEKNLQYCLERNYNIFIFDHPANRHISGEQINRVSRAADLGIIL
jgi:hypothetical protein